MSDADAEAWLSVAGAELKDVPADLLADACRNARRNCTHHGQIVPTVFREVEERWESRRRMRYNLTERAAPPQIEQAPWKPEPGELDAIKREVAEKLRADRDG